MSEDLLDAPLAGRGWGAGLGIGHPAQEPAIAPRLTGKDIEQRAFGHFGNVTTVVLGVLVGFWSGKHGDNVAQMNEPWQTFQVLCVPSRGSHSFENRE